MIDDIDEFDGSICYINSCADLWYRRLRLLGAPVSREAVEVEVEPYSKYDRKLLLWATRYSMRGRPMGTVFFPMYGFVGTDEQQREIFERSDACLSSLKRSHAIWRAARAVLGLATALLVVGSVVLLGLLLLMLFGSSTP